MPYTLTFEFLRINLKIYIQNKIFDVHVKLDPSVWPNTYPNDHNFDNYI